MTYIVVLAEEDKNAGDLIFTLRTSPEDVLESDLVIGEAETHEQVQVLIDDFTIRLIAGEFEVDARADNDWNGTDRN